MLCEGARTDTQGCRVRSRLVRVWRTESLLVASALGRDAAEGGSRAAATEGAARQASRISPKQALVTGYVILDDSAVQELYSPIMLTTFSGALGEEYQSEAISLTVCSDCCSLLSSLLSDSIAIDQLFFTVVYRRHYFICAPKAQVVGTNVGDDMYL